MSCGFLMKLPWLPAGIHCVSADCSHDSVLQQSILTTCIQSLPITSTNCDPSLGSLDPRTLAPSQTGLTPYKIDCTTTPSHFLGRDAPPGKSQTESSLVQIRPSSPPGPLRAPREHFERESRRLPSGCLVKAPSGAPKERGGWLVMREAWLYQPSHLP